MDLAGSGLVRIGSPVPVATYFGLVNSDCYLLMVDNLGWTLDDWRAWLIRLLSLELYGIDPAAGRSDSVPDG